MDFHTRFQNKISVVSRTGQEKKMVSPPMEGRLIEKVSCGASKPNPGSSGGVINMHRPHLLQQSPLQTLPTPQNELSSESHAFSHISYHQTPLQVQPQSPAGKAVGIISPKTYLGDGAQTLATSFPEKYSQHDIYSVNAPNTVNLTSYPPSYTSPPPLHTHAYTVDHQGAYSNVQGYPTYQQGQSSHHSPQSSYSHYQSQQSRSPHLYSSDSLHDDISAIGSRIKQLDFNSTTTSVHTPVQFFDTPDQLFEAEPDEWNSTTAPSWGGCTVSHAPVRTNRKSSSRKLAAKRRARLSSEQFVPDRKDVAKPIKPGQELYYSRKPRTVEYQPYSLSDFKCLPATERGTLGPDFESDDLIAKKQLHAKTRAFSNHLRRINADKAERSRAVEEMRSCSPPPPKELSAREKALLFAASIPKPRVTPTPYPSVDVLPPSGRRREFGSTPTPPSMRPEEELSTLDKQHQAAKDAVEAMKVKYGF